MCLGAAALLLGANPSLTAAQIKDLLTGSAYTDAFTSIRQVFAAQPAARQEGLTAQHFSFNVPGGRCDRCEGAGVLPVEMHFLPDVQVRCPVCHGRRFKREVLAVQYKGLDIAQVLELTIEEGLSLFAEVPAAGARLKLMAETGMGYLQLGQPASTFSGGEAQRVKLAKELSKRGTGRRIFSLLDPWRSRVCCFDDSRGVKRNKRPTVMRNERSELRGDRVRRRSGPSRRRR